MGLDAFGYRDVMAAQPPPEAVGVSQQSRIVIGVLAALVLIEAVPAGLWVRNRLRPPVVAEPVAAAALPAAASIPLASCEPAAGRASAAAVPAASPAGIGATATTGLAAKTTGAGAKPETRRRRRWRRSSGRLWQARLR